MQAGDVRFKLEASNPTGSFKDRFAAAEVARMLGAGRRLCLATSSGNTGSALAAYCARYGIAFHLFVNEHTPQEKLLQIRAYGARIYRVAGFGVDGATTLRVFELLQALAASARCDLIVSAFRYCPESMAALGGISIEIAGQLGGTPDHVFVPVGGGGLLTGIWRGFVELHQAGRVDRLPRIHAVQPAGNPTVFDAWRRGDTVVRTIRSATRISGLAVPFDIDASTALQSVYASGGSTLAPSDEEIWDAQKLLSMREGIYCEPAGATSVAGLLQAVRAGGVGAGERVVCIITGHGFKDSSAVERMTRDQETPLIAPEQIPGLDLSPTGLSTRPDPAAPSKP
jgi:threonine synthase